MSVLTWWASAKIKVLEWGAAIGALVATAAYIFIKGRSDGEAAGKLGEAQQTAKENAQSLEQLQSAIKVSNDVDTAINLLPPNAPVIVTPPLNDGIVATVIAPPSVTELDKADPNSSAGRLNILAKGGIVLAIMWITACTQQTVTKTDYCGPWKFITPNGKDQMTQSTSDQLLAHDCRGYRLNCWNPPGIAQACKNIGGK